MGNIFKYKIQTGKDYKKNVGENLLGLAQGKEFLVLIPNT
jgi:hypothetical protein